MIIASLIILRILLSPVPPRDWREPLNHYEVTDSDSDGYDFEFSDIDDLLVAGSDSSSEG